MSVGPSTIDDDTSPSWADINQRIGTPLYDLLTHEAILPGSTPSYQICKVIFGYHPLGAILTDAPISRAMAKPRDIEIPGLGESMLKKQFNATAKELGRIGLPMIMHTLFSMARMYGIASLAVGEAGKDMSQPLQMSELWKKDLFFNHFDPLNTAGSLVLDQNPNSPDFLKPRGPVTVNGVTWHPSRIFTKMHEQSLYIDWTGSAFGFTGRSVYQRALYPLKSFVQSMITDNMVTQKAGLIVYKAESPTSFITRMVQGFFGIKRALIKSGVNGQVLTIGADEAIETLNMQNLDHAYGAARMNILKNVASAARMPASIMAQETLTEGFGEGAEDMKKEIEYLDRIREEMDPGFEFVDKIIRRKAWTPEFYESLRTEYPEKYGEGGFDKAFYDWDQAFAAKWPNLVIEAESEKVEVEKIQFEAVIAYMQVMLPELPPEGRAKIIQWAADNVNDRERLFASKLIFDDDELKAWMETKKAEEEAEREPLEPAPKPFARTA